MSSSAFISDKSHSSVVATRFADTVSRHMSWMSLSIHLQLPTIIGVVVDNESRHGYRLLFTLLMKIRFVCQALERVWIQQCAFTKGSRVLSCVRHCMHVYVSNLIYFLQVHCDCAFRDDWAVYSFYLSLSSTFLLTITFIHSNFVVCIQHTLPFLSPSP